MPGVADLHPDRVEVDDEVEVVQMLQLKGAGERCLLFRVLMVCRVLVRLRLLGRLGLLVCRLVVCRRMRRLCLCLCLCLGVSNGLCKRSS